MVAYQIHFDGPQSKELVIGRVLINDRDRQMVTLQPYEAMWSGVRVVHRPCFQTPAGYSTVPSSYEAKESIRYDALVSQVELLTGGELTHGCSRPLREAGGCL